MAATLAADYSKGLHPQLKKKLDEVRAKRAFNPADWVNKKTDMLNEYMKKCGLKACVVNVSGGVDSAVTIAICKAAAKRPGSPITRIVGICQPIHSTEKIWKRGLELKEALDVEMVTVDQTQINTELQNAVDKAFGVKGGQFAAGQLRSYMRTPVAFYGAQLLGQAGHPAVVIGTGNYDEDGYLLYFCKCGDGVSDLQLIADLHKSEVFKVGHFLHVPKSILEAPPSADLWENQTDEGEFGFTYDFIELLTNYFAWPAQEQLSFLALLDPEARKEWDECSATAKKIHERNRHKEHYPLNLNCLKNFSISRSD